jgi:hypothetical protein
MRRRNYDGSARGAAAVRIRGGGATLTRAVATLIPHAPCFRHRRQSSTKFPIDIDFKSIGIRNNGQMEPRRSKVAPFSAEN